MFNFIKKLFRINRTDNTLLHKEIKLLKRIVSNYEDEISDKNKLIEALKAEYKNKSDLISINEKEIILRNRLEIYKSVSQLLINYPKVSSMVIENPELKAKDMLGMLKPLDILILTLNLETIGSASNTTTFDKTIHEPYKDDNISEGENVSIRFIGYKMNDIILNKARVERCN